jgi:hypothetical protein
MKYLLIALLLIATPVQAQTVTLATPETRQSISQYRIISVYINKDDQTAVIRYKLGYDDGGFVEVSRHNVTFKGSDFTQFITDSGISNSGVKTAFKNKLGLTE